MDVDEVLNILQTQFKILEFLAQLDDFVQELFRTMSFLVQCFLKNQGDQLYQLFSNTCLKNFFWIDLYHTNEISFHIEDTFGKK